MTATAAPEISIDTDAETALVDRLFVSAVETLELYGVYLGSRLGIYEHLADGHWTTVSELSSDLDLSARYIREWLEQQAVAGYIEVDSAAADGDTRRYRLPRAHVGPLADPEHASHLASVARAVVGVAKALPKVADAYRTGEGVPYSEYGVDFRHGQGGLNRPGSMLDLGEVWLPAAADLHERLISHPSPRIADVGSGQGWSAVGFAETYPAARVVGYDTDEASVADAREFVAQRELSQRVSFEVRDAATIGGEGPFDAVFMIEVLHDVARPVDVLSACREALAEDGSVIVVDEKVADTFTAPGDEVERMMYGWSISHCLPAGLAEEGSAGTGTVMRQSKVREYAAAAGFGTVEVLAVEHDMYRFYRLSD